MKSEKVLKRRNRTFYFGKLTCLRKEKHRLYWSHKCYCDNVNSNLKIRRRRKRDVTVEQRIKRCLLAEKMQEQEAYSKKLGLTDVSRFHGKRINEREENKIC